MFSKLIFSMHSLFRVLIFLAVLFIVWQPAQAQVEQNKDLSRQFMEIAIETMAATKAMDDARDQMVQAADLDTTNIKANFEAGHMHIQTINKELAVKYFLRIYRQTPNYRFDLEYWIGNSYHYGLEFDKAIDFYSRYKNKLAARPNYQGRDKIEMKEVERRIAECNNGKEFVAHPKNYSITNLGRQVNSEFDDYAPVLNSNETEIIFTTRRRDGNTFENVADDNKPYEDIFLAEKNGSAWNYSKNIGAPVNTRTYDSDLALSPDGNTLFIYKDDGGGDIYYCEKQSDGKWGEPQPLPGIINSTFRESSISITKDENVLYFASERPGGFGGSDIYVCTKDSKGEWSRVKNLGPNINTEFDEDGPYIDYDGKTLYFSSQGKKGMGGFDLFKSTLLNEKTNEWSEPENMGYPINSPDDDIYFVGTSDPKRWYYATHRDDGMGYTDIYVITEGEEKKEPVLAKEEPKKEEPKKEEPKKEEPKKEEPKKEQPKKEEPKKEEPKKIIQPIKYIVSVVDSDTETALDGKVKMAGAKDNVMVGVSQTGAGTYEFSITSTTAKDYRLSVEREGYIFYNEPVKIAGATVEAKVLSKQIKLRKLVVGASSVLRNIYFDFGKASFKTESYSELNKLLTMMKQNEGLQVEISGHTDSVGKNDFNKKLSQQRANAVKGFLTSKGIDPRRMKAVGYGEEKPLASNDDEEEGRQLNRRVEMKVLGN